MEKKVIINKPEVDQLVEEFNFEAYQAFAIDIVMSTGEGKTRQIDTKSSVYKRNPNVNYSLKFKSSRALLVQIKEKCGNFPFNLRSFENTRGSKSGITELVSHELVNIYPVLWERNGETVAQFKFTALILPSSTKKLNDGFPLPWVSSEFKIEDDPELAQIMATSTGKKKKPKKKKQMQTMNKYKTKGTTWTQPHKINSLVCICFFFFGFFFFTSACGHYLS